MGADGLILVRPSTKADFQMRIFNPDGSEPEMCGNGIRCFARFLLEKGITDKESLEVETKAGIIKPHVIEGGVRVDMGEPVIGAKEEELKLKDRTLYFTEVSMGNPHAVVFSDEDVEKVGSEVEVNSRFPKGLVAITMPTKAAIAAIAITISTKPICFFIFDLLNNFFCLPNRYDLILAGQRQCCVKDCR